jgi:DNA-directed RNA polymerase subunit alpha
MHPDDALTESARILMRHFAPLAEFSGEEEEAISAIEEPSALGHLYEIPIEDLDLAMRAYNCLKRAGITNVGEIRERLDREPAEMLAIRNFGQKSLAELVDKMKAKDYLPEDYDPEL